MFGFDKIKESHYQKHFIIMSYGAFIIEIGYSNNNTTNNNNNVIIKIFDK